MAIHALIRGSPLQDFRTSGQAARDTSLSPFHLITWRPPPPCRGAPPFTRQRRRSLEALVIDDEDLLYLILTRCSLRDLARTACINSVWQRASRDAYMRTGVSADTASTPPAVAATVRTLRVQKAVRTVYKYDEIADEWMRCADLTKAADHLGVVGFDGELHAVGGWSGAHNRASCETYCPRDDVWRISQHRLHTPRSGLVAAVREDGTCFVAGLVGVGRTSASSRAPRRSTAPMPSPRGRLSRPRLITPPSASEMPGRRITRKVRGSVRRREHRRTRGLGALADFRDAQNTTAPRRQGDRAAPNGAPLSRAASLGRFLYLTGGTGSSADVNGGQATPTRSVERLDTACHTAGWARDPVAPMLVPRYRHACAALDGRLYACGGQKIDGKATASVEMYDPSSNTWVHVAALHRARFSHAMASLHGRLYVVGGFADGEWAQ